MSPKMDLEHTSMQKIPYLATIGSLMYLAMTTQPDMAYTPSILA